MSLNKEVSFIMLKIMISASLLAFAITSIVQYFGASKKPTPSPIQTIYIHDTTIVRDIIIPCRLQPVIHDTIVIHVKD